MICYIIKKIALQPAAQKPRKQKADKRIINLAAYEQQHRSNDHAGDNARHRHHGPDYGERKREKARISDKQLERTEHYNGKAKCRRTEQRDTEPHGEGAAVMPQLVQLAAAFGFCI